MLRRGCVSFLLTFLWTTFVLVLLLLMTYWTLSGKKDELSIVKQMLACPMSIKLENFLKIQYINIIVQSKNIGKLFHLYTLHEVLFFTYIVLKFVFYKTHAKDF